MRTQFYILANCFFTLVVISSGCKKESTEIQTTTPEPQVNTAPIVKLQQDRLIVLPVNTLVLSGSVTDAEKNIKEYKWEKINGPTSVTILNPDAVTTTVMNLEKGIYEFELTATDAEGLWDKDTLKVTVYDPNQPGQKEALFSSLQSQCPMGCWVEISCVSCSVPPDKQYKVFVREEQDTQWFEAVHESQWTAAMKYSYITDKDRIWIFVPEEPTVFHVRFIY